MERSKPPSRARRLLHLTGFVPPLVAGVVATSSSRAVASSGWAAESPLDDVSPSSAGLPGAGLFAQILSWGFWIGLGVCGLAIVYGAATWRGMNGNSGRGVEGKMYVAAGAIGAMIIGLAPTIVNVLFDAGRAG